MKLHIKCLFVLIFLISGTNLLSQDNPKNYPQLKDFYPYHLNDVWQYFSTQTGTFTTKKITRIDTSHETNSHYIYYNNSMYWADKIVLDSSLVYSRVYSKPLYRFNIPLKTIWNIVEDEFWMMYSYDSEVMIGDEIIDEIDFDWSFWYCPDTSQIFAASGDYLVKGIGLYSHWWEGGEKTLNGCIIDGVEYGIIIGVDVEDELTPVDYKVTIKNYPNPFNNQTIIKYTIPEAEFVNITMYDMLGRELEVLKNEYQNAGVFSIPWTAKGLSSGVYFAVIRFKSQMLTQKIIYQK